MMLEILPSPDHVAAYRLAGTLDGEDYDRMIADIEARLARHERIGVLADLTGFKDITFQAAYMDARYSLSKLFQLKRFPREAVITDRQWIRTMAHIVAPLVPFVELRTFVPGNAAEAMDWVAGIR